MAPVYTVLLLFPSAGCGQQYYDSRMFCEKEAAHIYASAFIDGALAATNADVRAWVVPGEHEELTQAEFLMLPSHYQQLVARYREHGDQFPEADE